ncbi:MAG TPA: ArsC/Spx/MgsR family protein [Dehalococcoidia bacterium]|nr:ArsC/Spx/MgsR family protein [Dehalococcoidia bacterium]HLB28794.1 ArsC/Spx/MgsR family protein [Dehalococcoidia bacterium]
MGELRQLLGGRPAAAIFSWQRARKLGLDMGADAAEETLLELMARDPTLVRRPIIVVGQEMMVGFSPKGLERLLG